MSRRLSRLRRVVVVVWIIARHLAGYGVAVVRCRLGLGRVDAIGTARRVRRAIEDLGVAAIKIGQILSTRGDLLVPPYRTELANLQDAAPPEPFATMMATLTTELGRPIEAVFTQFDPRPVAAASIGQAHAATLPDGSAVIVKI